MRITPVLKGMASYVPGLFDAYVKIMGTGIPVTAKHYYSIWLYHLYISHKYGLPTDYTVVAELGPGDTLGTGLAALLTGAQKYYSLDIIRFANQERNIRIFEDLIELFEKREKISLELFGMFNPQPMEDGFPYEVLTDKRLKETLNKDRIREIKQILLNSDHPAENIQIQYYTPWNDPAIIQKGSVDLIISHAVMEHVDDLEPAYEAMSQWLKVGGIMSHQIDYRCHQTGNIWNEHWSYPDFIWKLIRGKRDYLLNREPHSTHIKMVQKHGFKVLCDLPFKDFEGIPRKNLSSRFKSLSEEDLTTYGAIIQALKN